MRGQYHAGDRQDERKGGIAYEDEGPRNVIFFSLEVVNEEEQNAGDDDGREQLAQPY